jgi:glyoxylase-like metal-dependent hydrolase (beta-lactamase superfamily II)
MNEVPQSTPTATPKAMHIGPYHLRPVRTGIFGLDGGAMFGTVPKVLWEKTNPADSQNRIQMEARTLLLESSVEPAADSGADLGSKSGTRKVLIDCGIGADFSAKYGEKLGPKFAEMFAINVDPGDSRPAIVKNLQAMGIEAEEITDVILTHLHFDHAGGATCVRDGKLVPTFQNARYYVQRANLETAKTPNLRERASYYAANFQPLLDAGVLTLFEGDVENFLPNISVTVTNGHTVGQQTVQISDDKTTLVYCGDLIPTSTHVRLPWVMGYDLEPLTLMQEKLALLTPAAQGGWYLFFEHDPYFDAAQIAESKGDFAVKERFSMI